MSLPALLLPQQIARSAARRPEKLAYAFVGPASEPEELSYAALLARASGVAAMLRAADCGKGARVALVFEPGLNFAVALLGAFLAGCAAVPVAVPSSARARGRADAILRESGCAAVLTDTQTLAGVPDSWPAEIACTRCLRVDTAVGSPVIAPQTSPDDIAFLQYTSGSTGAPKGVVVTHRALLGQMHAIQRAVQGSEDERVVTWLPPEHDMGLVGGVLFPCWLGGSVYILSPQSFVRRPVLWLDTISRYRGTITVAPNFAFELCVRTISPARRAELDLSSCRVLLNGSEPVRPETIDAFVETFADAGLSPGAVMPCYGLAEATLLVAGAVRGSGALSAWFDPTALDQRQVTEVAEGQGRRLVSSGLVRTSHPVRIVDPDARRACPPDRIGEIWIAGDSLGSAYHNRPDASEATFGARLDDGSGPYLRSGDLGFLWQGELFVTGRIKDVVLWHGRTLHASDLETSLEGVDPGLRRGRVAVHQRPDGAVAVLCEITPGRLAEDEALAARIWRQLLDRSGVEAAHVLLLRTGSLLWTTSGKLRRADSDAALAETPERVLLDWSPRAASQTAQVRAVAIAKLKQALAGTGDPYAAYLGFFADWIAVATQQDVDAVDPMLAWADQGLDSLMITEMILDLEAATGQTLTADILFELPEPAALAAALARGAL